MEPTVSEPTRENKILNLLNVILEYIKVLVWPVILVVAFLMYGDKLFNIIENREIDAFGLKIGKEIDDITENYEAQISLLKEELKRTNSSPGLLEIVEGIESNLEKQLSQVKSSALQQQSSLSSLSKKERVSKLERDGYEAIVDRDVINAIDYFSDARDLWSDYHNVSEIRKLLIMNKKNLEDSSDIKSWKNIVEVILQKYSWGMPGDIREKLVEFIA